jgi:hypothetical protein
VNTLSAKMALYLPTMSLSLLLTSGNEREYK